MPVIYDNAHPNPNPDLVKCEICGHRFSRGLSEAEDGRYVCPACRKTRLLLERQHPNLWTQEEKNIVLSWCHGDITKEQMLEYLPNRSFNAVRNLVFRMDYPHPDRSAYTRRTGPGCWTEEQDRQLAELRNKGYTAAQIAELLGHSKQSVSNRAHTLHLPKVKTGRRPKC